MSSNAAYPSHPSDEYWAWEVLSSTATAPAMPALSLPLSHQSPMYRSPSAASSQMSGPAIPWLPSPASSVYSPTTNNLPSDFDTSPIEPLMHDFPVGFDLDVMNTPLGDFSQSWLNPDPDAAASMDFLNTYIPDAVFPGHEFVSHDFGLGAGVSHFTPPGSVSPTASLFATPVIGPHLGAPTPASLPSPPAPPAAPTQLLPCPEPTCSNVYHTPAELKKHTKSHRPQRFPCPLPRCGKPHKDQRGLNRHLHAQHRAYAEVHNVPSENAACPRCGEASRRDNMVRHMKKKHPEMF
ncbi:hypothetical protein C8A05DRAFT_34116 [Staphylotrichum tortipilum]|uniref:C2H2-type domain-containing protein n=1 Tax=Staphylotrichum tortipilum TaxID=2831512 RepID=A0AAN6RTR5_9PEZI|nr:hypothetical protein C8A05DRAFT_34116 [Staphylotrichum longicolle]